MLKRAFWGCTLSSIVTLHMTVRETTGKSCVITLLRASFLRAGFLRADLLRAQILRAQLLRAYLLRAGLHRIPF